MTEVPERNQRVLKSPPWDHESGSQRTLEARLFVASARRASDPPQKKCGTYTDKVLLGIKPIDNSSGLQELDENNALSADGHWPQF